ncbi:extensin family protein [Jannaschia sp. 2305UL9-9]|uniref:extensin-like domain-containing protein n=1 Tax=Jannaschia sp. 2305UL9-9 TaxID=3121638 RepID=UPI003527AF74
MTARVLVAALALTAASLGAASAEIRPSQRPTPEAEIMAPGGSVQIATATAVPASTRPVARITEERRALLTMMSTMQAARPVIDPQGLVRRSDRPLIRDGQAIPVAARRPRQDTGAGGICGRGSIKGEVIAPVSGDGACGIPNAVRVTAVSGVTLTRPARMDCGTAQALDTWVRDGVVPVVGRRGGGAVALQVAAGYACRTRNNQPGARVSEHGKGRAIDISGIRLANGTTISVLRDWGRGAEGRILRDLHARACGPFGTVLGPESDVHHRDHFHFDTASYRSGSYCR